MPQVVSCPACACQLNLPDALAGKPVRCPKCTHTFTATFPKTTCPICSASAPIDAENCPDCGYVLMAPTKVEVVEEKPNICNNPLCNTLNPPGERLCQRCNTPLPEAAGQMVGKRYRIDKLLATGGFGIVYRGTDLHTGQNVAIKEMIATEPKEFQLRKTFFQREAEILKLLQPLKTVPRLFDYLDQQTAAYLIMEYIPGDNLLNVLEKAGNKPFPLSKVVRWGLIIAEVLHYMHRLNPPLIHRDMKPENIMLAEDQDTIRLIDFGTARGMGQTIRERGVAKTKVYTEDYAPPEQIIGRPEARSDVFALAGTLYHLATGRSPEGFFTGKEILDQLNQYPAQERWFYQLVGQNLSEDKNDRYLDAAAFARDLNRQMLTTEHNCPKCQRSTPTKEPYCQHCTEPLAGLSVYCQPCQKALPTGCRYCVFCGARLS